MATEVRPAEEQIALVDHVDLLQELDDCWGKFPESALRFCQQHREIATPFLIRSIEKATERALAGDEFVGDAHWIGLYLLWESQAKEALPAILTALRLPRDRDSDLFGDAVTEAIPRILATLAPDQLDLIEELIGNRELDPFVRWAAADSLKYLVRDGLLSMQEAVEVLRRRLSENLMDPQVYVTEALIITLCDLDPRPAETEIKAAFGSGVVDETMIDRKFVEQAIAAGGLAEKEFAGLPPTRLDDAVEHMRQFYCFNPRPPVRTESSAFTQSPERTRQHFVAPRSEAENLPSPQSQTIRNEERRIGRNDPCPCGSGKKYKKCCLRDQGPEIPSLF